MVIVMDESLDKVVITDVGRNWERKLEGKSLFPRELGPEAVGEVACLAAALAG